MDLTTTYMGLKLKNPLVPSSSPLMSKVDSVRAMEDAGQMVQIKDAAALHRHVQLWQNNPPPDAPIGYILSLEGADSIVTLKHLERAYAQGLRAVGPAHYGPGTYAYGTDATEMTPGSRPGEAPAMMGPSAWRWIRQATPTRRAGSKARL